MRLNLRASPIKRRNQVIIRLSIISHIPTSCQSGLGVSDIIRNVVRIHDGYIKVGLLPHYSYTKQFQSIAEFHSYLLRPAANSRSESFSFTYFSTKVWQQFLATQAMASTNKSRSDRTERNKKESLNSPSIHRSSIPPPRYGCVKTTHLDQLHCTVLRSTAKTSNTNSRKIA